MRDGIDLSQAVFHNSPNVSAWAVTSTITRLEFRPTGVHVDHTKIQGDGAWPNFRPAGWDGDLQYTLWLFLQIAGQWHGSGCIQFWQSCDQNGGPPEEFAKNWYYAADRWAPMTGHQPAPGEMVGFMVSAGDARNNGVTSVQERSQVVLMPFPVSGASYFPPTDPVPTPQPPPTPPTPPAPPPVPPPSGTVVLNSAQYAAIMARFDRLEKQLAQARADVKSAGAQILAELPKLLLGGGLFGK